MSFVILAVSALVLLLSLLYLKWRSVKQYWADKGIPFEPPHPLLGNLTTLLHENVGLWYRKMYEKHVAKSRTPYLGVWYFWNPVLMINCPTLARNILNKHAANFRNRLVGSSPYDPIGALNIFTVDDPLWTKVRQRLTPVFTSAKLKQLQPFIQQKSGELVQRIYSEKDSRINLRDTLADFTTDVIGTSAFGVVSNATLTGESPLRKVTKDFMKFSVYRGLCMSSIFFWPELVGFFRFSFFPKHTTAYFRKIYKIITSQRETEQKGTRNKDLLDALLQIKKEAALEDNDITDEVLVAQSVIFLQGGFDTTASTLTFTILELAYAPELQEKMYAELQEANENNDPDKFYLEILEKLVYFNCVIKEILRKYPAMPWLDRITTNDYDVDDKLTIKAGTPIAINHIGMHFDPEYFPDPYTFNPDRFLPENEKDIKPYTYLPFGEGPRNCIGMRFGLMTMRTALSSLILKYKFEPYSDTPHPNKAEIEKKGMFYMPGEPIYIKFVPRS